ncbi:MAG: hypothetical protein FJ218_07195 [Ignavibacteria bacterium]|nr:hypothetical protein [Ignavibacteria bacterium]
MSYYNTYSSKSWNKPAPKVEPPKPKPHWFEKHKHYFKWFFIVVSIVGAAVFIQSIIQDFRMQQQEKEDLTKRIRELHSLMNTNTEGVYVSAEKIDELATIAQEYRLSATQLFKIIKFGQQLTDEIEHIMEYSFSKLHRQPSYNKQLELREFLRSELELLRLLEILTSNSGTLFKTSNDGKAKQKLEIGKNKFGTILDKFNASEDIHEDEEAYNNIASRGLTLYIIRTFNLFQDYHLAETLDSYSAIEKK